MRNTGKPPSWDAGWRHVAVLAYLAVLMALFVAMGLTDVVMDACWHVFAVY